MKVLIKLTGQIGSCQAKKPEKTQSAEDASRPGGEGGWKDCPVLKAASGCWDEADEVAKNLSSTHVIYLLSKLQFLSSVKVFFLVLS